ncbi:TonB-dependent receptor [Alteraurantiacibacter aestuarii]|uniref:TonB-dependent receptor n=1 Tax=Alteraurantiacibacter aestuarii TaxID=650004 RepID=UPI0031D1A20F
MFKPIILASSSIVALATPQLAYAQQTAPQDQADTQEVATPAGRSSGGDIVVTATRIATNVQDVPIAITAVSAEMLEERQLNTFADLGRIVPNATFRKSEGIYGAGVSVTLRGLGTTDTQFSNEPAVAYYIDDVYYPFLFGSNFDLLDIDHVEVLRGPQGTLFGRNAISGAVNLVSKTPSLTETSGYFDITVGSNNRREIRAGVSLPLTDNLAVSVSGISKQRDGYMDLLDFSCEMNLRGTPELAGTFPFQTNGTSFGAGRSPDNCVIGHFGGEDAQAVRGSLYWEPAPNVAITLIADYTDENNESAAETVFETDYALTLGLLADGTPNPSPSSQSRNFITAFDQFSIPGTPFRWDQRFETGDIYSTYDNFCDPFPAGKKITGNGYYNGSLFRGGNCNASRTVPLRNWGVSGKVVVGLTDEIDATAIAGYREIDTVFGAAWDGTPLNDSFIFHEDHMWYWNGEFRLSGQHDAVDWVAGLFYYDAFADELGRPQNTRLGTQQIQNVYYSPEAKAAFANATFRPYDAFGFMEGLSISGGLRYSDDRKAVDYAAQQDATPAGSTNFVASATSTYFTLPIENKRWDWKIGLNYEISPDALVYASAATGYRLPGFQTRLFQVGQQEQQSPTSLISYEIGGKLDLFDRRLRINAAAFWMAYSISNGSFGGQEPRLTTDATGIRPGNSTLIPDGPANTQYASDFTSCRDYSAATDGPKNGTTVGIECISRTFNYAVKGGDPIRGVELEITAEPIDQLVFNGSLGYTDRGGTTGRPVGFPDWTASGGVQYTADAPMLHGSITPRLDWFYTSTIAYSTNFPQYDEPSRSIFNARINYENDDYDFNLALGVTNLFDAHYFRQKTIFTVIGAPANIGQPAPPREWYLTLSKRF